MTVLAKCSILEAVLVFFHFKIRISYSVVFGMDHLKWCLEARTTNSIFMALMVDFIYFDLLFINLPNKQVI